MSSPIRYPLDLTGLSLANLVTSEAHTLASGLAVRALAPLGGPFFVSSIIVTDVSSGAGSSGVVLSNTQYSCVELQQDASMLTGQEICSLILITDSTVGNSLSITYQVLGGDYQNNATTVIQAYEAVLQDSRPVDWSNVLNKPTQYPPSLHEHLLTDVYGFQSIVASLERVRNAIILSDVPTLDAVVAWVQQNWGNVENIPVVTNADIAAGLPMRKYITYDVLMAANGPIITGQTNYGMDSGTIANTYIVNLNPAIPFIIPDGFLVSLGVASSRFNTGACTLNGSPIKDKSGNDLAAGAIGLRNILIWDNTLFNFILVA